MSLQYAIELLNCPVALAGRRFEFFAVTDSYGPTHVFNSASLLKNPGCQADAWSPGAKHLRQKFMRDREIFGLDPILAHQQPARQPLLNLNAAAITIEPPAMPFLGSRNRRVHSFRRLRAGSYVVGFRRIQDLLV